MVKMVTSSSSYQLHQKCLAKRQRKVKPKNHRPSQIESCVSSTVMRKSLGRCRLWQRANSANCGPSTYQ